MKTIAALLLAALSSACSSGPGEVGVADERDSGPDVDVRADATAPDSGVAPPGDSGAPDADAVAEVVAEDSAPGFDARDAGADVDFAWISYKCGTWPGRLGMVAGTCRDLSLGFACDWLRSVDGKVRCMPPRSEVRGYEVPRGCFPEDQGLLGESTWTAAGLRSVEVAAGRFEAWHVSEVPTPPSWLALSGGSCSKGLGAFPWSQAGKTLRTGTAEPPESFVAP